MEERFKAKYLGPVTNRLGMKLQEIEKKAFLHCHKLIM